MEHIIKIRINDQSKVAKDLLVFLDSFAKSTNAITIEHKTVKQTEEVKKITFDQLFEVADKPLRIKLEAYRKKGITDLRKITKELGFTREDKEDFALLIMMKEAKKEGLADTETVLKKLGIS